MARRESSFESWLLAPLVASAIAASSPAFAEAELDFAELRIHVAFSNALAPPPLGPPTNGTLTFLGDEPVGTALSDDHASLAAGNAFAGWDAFPLLPTTPGTFVEQIDISIGSNAIGVFTGASLEGPATFDAAVTPVVTSGGFTFVTLYVPFQLGGPAAVQPVTGVVATVGPFFYAQFHRAPFQTGPISLSGLPTSPPIQGFNSLTPSGDGTLLLVSPVFVQAPGYFDMRGYAELELRYVPEPGTTALLLWGVGALLFRARVLARRSARGGES